MPTALLYGYAALLGALIGSFLNVCVHRWPLGESVIRPRSRCAVCRSPVAWYDNVPIVSWIVLRGRCRTCGTRISVQYPVVEAATALIWLAAAVRFGSGVDALHAAIFLTLLLGIALTDARHMLIPDQFTIVGAAIGLVLALLGGPVGFRAALVGAAAGFVVLWAVKLLAEAVLKKPALGVGDIHMIAMVGAFLGVGGMLLTIMLGSILGLFIGVPLLLVRGRLKAMQTYLPLGTFLALGAAVAHAWGVALIDAYMRFVLG